MKSLRYKECTICKTWNSSDCKTCIKNDFTIDREALYNLLESLRIEEWNSHSQETDADIHERWGQEKVYRRLLKLVVDGNLSGALYK